MSGEGVIIAAIGASAGGLQAFEQLLQAVPSDTGVAWVLVQHLDPTHESRLAELLDRHTELPVLQVRHDVEVQPDHVFVIPPDRDLAVEDGRFVLTEPAEPRRRRLSIDHFFRSVAEAGGRRTIGVVLSGTGADGTSGLGAIRAAGGLTIAQEPAGAGHPGMPRSALAARVADLTLPAAEIPAAIVRFVRHPYVQEDEPGSARDAGAATDESAERAAEEQALVTGLVPAVIELVRERPGIDLSNYKESTLLRRIERCMGLVHLTRPEDYVERLRGDLAERRRLVRDLHVHVTDFFRDADAFDALGRSAIPAMFEAADARTGEDRVVRAWVPGCATGEEAYSVAIALLEEREARWADAGIPIQVFATDVDAGVLDVAQAATYPDCSLEPISPERRRRFFRALQAPGLFRVRRTVRDAVSFARHDVLGDPPFSRLDLVSCRNLLIYLRQHAQETALSAFHFALRPGAFLLLGPSEFLGHSSDQFRVVDRGWRLFQRLDRWASPVCRPIPSHRPRPLPESPVGPAAWVAEPEPERDELAALRALADVSVPPSVLVDRRHRIVYVHGDLIDVLDLPRGAPGDLALPELLRDEIRSGVRAALFRAARTGEPVTTGGRLPGRDGVPRDYEVRIAPGASSALGDGLLVVSFLLRPAVGTRSGPMSTESIHEELDREVTALRGDLRATVDELERSNEQLRASNEEAMTMNEELETQSEELRSVNDELTSVNGRLQEKMVELREAHEDITNLLVSARLPAIFLDRDLRVRRCTAEARKILGLSEHDVGRPIAELPLACPDEHLIADARGVAERLTPLEREIRGDGGAWYLRRILPYRTSDDRIAGVVVTYAAVTRLKQLTADLGRERRLQAAVADLGLRALLMPDEREVADHAVRLVADVLGCRFAALLERVPSGIRLSASIGWDPALADKVIAPDDPGSEPGHVLRASGPVLVEDLAEDRRFAGLEPLAAAGARSGVGVVVTDADGRAAAVLAAHATEPGAFTDHHAAFLRQVANVLSGTRQRCAAEDALARSEDRFRLAAEATRDALWDFDLRAGRVWWSETYARRFGRPASTADSWTWWVDRIHEEDREATVRSLRQALSGSATSWQAEYRFRDVDGAYPPIWDRAVIARDADGTAIRILGAMLDMSEQRAREQEVLESRRRLQSIIDNAPVAVFAKDVEGRFVLTNRRHAAILGAEPDDVIGRRDEDFEAVRPRAAERRRLDRAAWDSDAAVETEERIEADGEVRSFLALRFPLVDRAGRTYAVCGIAADITDRKRDEEHLRHVMAELNHRVKNTLASIDAIALVTGRSAESLEEFLTSFGARLRAMSAAHGLLTQTEWRGASIREVLTSELAVRVASRDRLRLEGPELELRPRVVLALHMAAHELATNAAKYGALSRPAGRVEVRWALEPASADGDDAVRLCWIERGGPPTTEPTREGFGGRLIRQLLEYDLGGRFEARFRPSGFQAEMWFPLADARPGDPREEEPEPAAEDPSAPVLVVEDAATIALSLRDELVRRGHRVLGPAGTLAAAERLVEREAPAAALLDIDLDGERVYPLAERLAARGVPCAFVSGFEPTDVPRDLRGLSLFRKPLRLGDVDDWLATVLPDRDD